MRIADWPLKERPRERLLALGAAALSDAERLAVFLRTGARGKSALDLARELLSCRGGLSGLLGAAPAPGDLGGVGPAKTTQLAAVLEVARRCLREELRAGSALTSPASVRDYLRLALAGREHEVFVALFLDALHRVLRIDELFRGTLTQTSVYRRKVVKAALAGNAAAVIFASGVAQPSQADELLTRQLKRWRWSTSGCSITSSSPATSACRSPKRAALKRPGTPGAFARTIRSFCANSRSRICPESVRSPARSR